MELDKVTEIFFSPTNTTKEVITAIAKGIGVTNTEAIDLTKPAIRDKFNLHIESSKEILILGVPVYEERIPEILERTLTKLKGEEQAIILVALYGNIGEGIALKQLKALAEQGGFKVVGAASFIGEHSFSTSKLEIAQGRPDRADLKQAEEFGKRIAKKLKNSADIHKLPELKIEGKLPLIAKVLPRNSARFFAQKPKVEKENCNSCGICVSSCPVGAIAKDNLEINDMICLRCFACVRVCPQEARKINFKKGWIVKFILKMKSRKRKEPRTYL